MAGKDGLKPSKEEYDWLDHGIYFWADSPHRAWDWANECKAAGKFRTPIVLGALIYPGLCLNLTDYGVIEELRAAYAVLNASRGGRQMPTNSVRSNGIPMVRRLDCAVIEMLYQLRRENDWESYDTVYGVFDEGELAYPGAGFKEKTHIQLAVRNPEIVIAYFRVKPSEYLA